jgi:hypothetical protein
MKDLQTPVCHRVSPVERARYSIINDVPLATRVNRKSLRTACFWASTATGGGLPERDSVV